MRQRSNSTLLRFFVWSAYLLADWVAAVGIGLIIQSQTNLCEPNGGNDNLFAFWASFLLLHLGGPDSITSFALEDNELWLRHLFGLVLQVVGAAYCVYLTLPNNELWLPTALVFVVGTIKYGERTFALYLASWNCFGAASLPEPEPGTDYEDAAAAAHVEAPVTATYNSNDGDPPLACSDRFRATSLPERDPVLGPDSTGVAAATTHAHDEVPKRATNNLNDAHEGSTLKDSDAIKLLPDAYKLYESYIKGFVVGLVPTLECQVSTRNAFLNLAHGHLTAFRIIEYELSFLYESLHTKVVVACGRIGYLVRFVSFCFIVISSMLFIFSDEKHVFDKFDTGVTYALLFGAIVLDFISLVQLISSDWNWNAFAQYRANNWFWRFFGSVNNAKRRWSGSVLQYDIISYCLHEPPMWVYKLVDLFLAREIVDKIRITFFSSSEKVSEDLKALIFNELRSENMSIPNSKKMGEFYLDGKFTDHYLSNLKMETFSNSASSLNRQVLGKHFGQDNEIARDLLSHHLAIEVYYHESMSRSNNERTDDYQLISEGEKGKETSKFISNYVFYLMAMQQRMVSQLLDHNWEEILHDTCDEIKRFCKENKISRHSEACLNMKEKFKRYSLDELKEARLKERSDSRKPGASKSVLTEACITANIFLLSGKVLDTLKNDLWIFLLLTSMSCRPGVFTQQLSKGGEFLTLLWLLLTQLGLVRNVDYILF
ncbi:hypothetical protein PanWU01x14_231490 [Parasponia andersonii]|uniref:DUF4220 domain-containing protein n=1 Tax=Parasponia andersonii TaxID=3476 RepID=A0A2P5BKG0_PARAD|nr:hypothetical protein PanWU01x14_231490 [Parasponia andersonii]